MFDLVHKHKRIAQFILALIMMPFAFFGVDYYFRGGGGVGDGRDSRRRQDHAKPNSTQRDPRAAGTACGAARRSFDPAMFDNPEVRFALVEQLVSAAPAREAGRATSTSACRTRSLRRSSSRGSRAFQDDGKFSPDRYRTLLRQRRA